MNRQVKIGRTMNVASNGLFEEFAGGDIKTADAVSVSTKGLFEMRDTEVPLLSPAAVLKAYLKDVLGVIDDYNSTGDWPTFLSHVPDGNSNVISIYDTSGSMDGRLMVGDVMEHYGIQIALRSRTYQTGWQKIREIVANIEQIHYNIVEVNDVTYTLKNMARTTPIIPLGVKLGDRRFLFTVNYLMSVNQL